MRRVENLATERGPAGNPIDSQGAWGSEKSIERSAAMDYCDSLGLVAAIEGGEV